MISIDLNCDLGEFDDRAARCRDVDLLALVSSVNIAAGGHAGSRDLIRRTAVEAAARGVAVGVHPGFEDREHFGRRLLQLPPSQVADLIARQLEFFAQSVADLGVAVAHVKPHGGLYHRAADDRATARAVAEAVAQFDRRLKIYALTGGELISAAAEAGLVPIREAFADRAYLANGRLAPRSIPGALLDEPHAAAQRIVRLLTTGFVDAIDSTPLRIEAQTICLHGDRPDALSFAAAIREGIVAAGIRVRAPGN